MRKEVEDYKRSNGFKGSESTKDLLFYHMKKCDDRDILISSKLDAIQVMFKKQSDIDNVRFEKKADKILVYWVFGTLLFGTLGVILSIKFGG